MLKSILFVGMGGALGSTIRYLIAFYTTKHYSGTFPLSTFIINITGCILIGLFIGLADRFQFISPEVRLFLITGFCGGYTTFSTFSSENLQLLQNGSIFTLLYYISLSILLGVLGVWGGFILSKI